MGGYIRIYEPQSKILVSPLVTPYHTPPYNPLYNPPLDHSSYRVPYLKVSDLGSFRGVREVARYLGLHRPHGLIRDFRGVVAV